jgi:hypothetical protein
MTLWRPRNPIASPLAAHTTHDPAGDLPHAPCLSVPTGCPALLLAILEDLFLVRDTLNRISSNDGRYRSLTGGGASDSCTR